MQILRHSNLEFSATDTQCTRDSLTFVNVYDDSKRLRIIGNVSSLLFEVIQESYFDLNCDHD